MSITRIISRCQMVNPEIGAYVYGVPGDGGFSVKVIGGRLFVSYEKDQDDDRGALTEEAIKEVVATFVKD